MTNEFSITLNFYQKPKNIMDYKIFLKNETHFKYLKIFIIEF